MSITKIKKLRIFLCDLTYDSIILVSDTIPINIGFVGLFNYFRDIISDFIKTPLKVLLSIGYFGSKRSWNKLEIFAACLIDQELVTACCHH